MLLDIDLDELKFLIEPSYEFLKDKIPYIMEAYIREYGEEYREHIKENYDKVSYIFLNTMDDVNSFIHKFRKQIVIEAYKPLFLAFNLEFSEMIKSDNFINIIFRQHENCVITQDDNLQIFRNDIRGYLIDMKENEKDIQAQQFLDTQIKYIDDTILKFERIMGVLNPKIKQIESIKAIINQKKMELQREFIDKHSYLLSSSELEFIKKNKDYDVAELINNSRKLKNYLSSNTWNNQVFDVGDLVWFKSKYDEFSFILDTREEMLSENNIDYKHFNIGLSDGDALLKLLGIYYTDEMGNRYEGSKALDALDEEFEKYDKKFKKIIDYYKYLMPRDEFIKKYILNNLFTQDITCLTDDELIELSDAILKSYENVNYSNFLAYRQIQYNGVIENFQCSINTACLDQYDGMFFNSDGKIVSPFSTTFDHELGHVATIRNNISGLNSNSDLELLNELINEYMNQKKNEHMDKRGVLFKSSCIVNNNEMSIYFINFFLLEPLVNRCEDLLKDASINNIIDIIIDFMGYDLFKEYIDIINSFFKYQMTNYHDLSEIFVKEREYIENTKEKINDIMLRVDERNLESKKI